MESIFGILNTFYILCRVYTIPISLMSCLVPFVFALFAGGNILYGIIAVIGTLILHMATNLFDDIVDYIREKRDIDRGLKIDYNFQPNKCALIRDGKVSLKSACLIVFVLFLISLFIAVFFLYIFGVKLLYVLIPTVIICLLYPVLGCLGLGEILVAIVFSPLIYSGVYFVMTGNFSLQILVLSISTGLLSVAVLHNHMLLDYKVDTSNRKITLCRICGSESNALNLLILIITFAYINILIWILSGYLSLIYVLTFLTVPISVTLINVMKLHIVNPAKEIDYNIFMGSMRALKKFPPDQRGFIMKFLLAQNILYSFSIMLCIAVVADFWMSH